MVCHTLPCDPQLFDEDTYTYTYLVGDKNSGEAALIDPVIDKVTRDLQIISDLGLKLKYAGECGRDSKTLASKSKGKYASKSG